MAKKQPTDDNLQELKAAIRNKDLGRLYIFHGEEVFLLNHYFEQIKKLLLDDLTESFNFHRLNNESFDIQSFVDGVENFPMMAEHTLVQVDEVDLFKLPEGDRNKIADILSDIRFSDSRRIQAYKKWFITSLLLSLLGIIKTD